MELVSSPVKRALPGWLRILWLCFAPVGLMFAARVAWEKTVWTWTRGPQVVGFSLLHIHPFLAIVGVLCCYALIAWLIPAVPLLVVRRKNISLADIAMASVTGLAALFLFLPDNFFA